MATTLPGTVLVTPWGEWRVVLEAEGAHEYIARTAEGKWRMKTGAGAMERCALYGATQQEPRPRRRMKE